MNAAVIIVVLTTLLIHCGHCQQRVTFSALQDTPKTLHSLNMRSISNPGCGQAEFDNIARQKCGVELTSPEDIIPFQDVCQQQCRDALVAFYTRCNRRQQADAVRRECTNNNAGSSAEAPTFFKALFVLTSIVMAMLLL